MGRTWLLRGAAVAVVAVLVGAWAVGLVGAGDTAEPPANVTTPVSPDNSPASDDQRPTVLHKAKSRRTREKGPSEEPLAEPSPDSTDVPAGDAPGTPPPTGGAHTPDPPSPSEEPSDSPTPTPQPPSNPPSQPDDECTDLVAIIDCALDPITGHP